MKNELNIDVHIKLNISDETAQTCLEIAKTYCRERLGDFDAGDVVCRGCALLDGIFCNLKSMPVCANNE